MMKDNFRLGGKQENGIDVADVNWVVVYGKPVPYDMVDYHPAREIRVLGMKFSRKEHWTVLGKKKDREGVLQFISGCGYIADDNTVMLYPHIKVLYKSRPMISENYYFPTEEEAVLAKETIMKCKETNTPQRLYL